MRMTPQWPIDYAPKTGNAARETGEPEGTNQRPMQNTERAVKKSNDQRQPRQAESVAFIILETDECQAISRPFAVPGRRSESGQILWQFRRAAGRRRGGTNY